MQADPRIRTVIVDDEPLARDSVRLLLRRDPDIEIIAECGNGAEASSFLLAHRTDLLFLDIQMPEMSGFDVLRRLPPSSMPAVVFVTAFDEFAIEAFEVRALDYLLKPFDDERFMLALARAKSQIRQERIGEFSRRLLDLLEHHAGQDPTAREEIRSSELRQEEQDGYLTRLMIKSGGRVLFLRVEDIVWIEAADNYVQLHIGQKKAHLLRETLNALEAKLSPSMFFRIHRSTIVNLNHVVELQPYANGDYVVLLDNGMKLKLSRGRYEKLNEKFRR